MERFPTNNEDNEQEQPKRVLEFDAVGDTGNVFYLIGRTRRLLDGEQRQAFSDAIAEATAPGAGKNYDDILALVNEYVHLADTSGEYPQYKPLDELGAIDGTIPPEQ